MEHQSPKVSVIIPTYNRAHLIGETIDSVLKQTFKDFELVIVDDGSTDNTEQLVSEHDDDRIKYHKISNSGQSEASNVGILKSNGEYMALLDSDDLWESSFLEVMLDCINTYPQYDFCYCNYSYFDESGLISDDLIDYERRVDGNLFDSFMKGTFVCTGSYLIKRKHMIAVGMMDPSIPVVTDWDLWLRLSYKYSGKYVDRCLLQIRRHEVRLSHNISEMARCNLIVLYRIKHNYPDAFKKHRKLLAPQLCRNHRVVAGHFRRKGRFIAAVQHYLKSF